MDEDGFKEVLAHWAATVTVVAIRDEGRVYGTTATSFTPVAVDPPTVVISLGPNAQVRPFMDEGALFVVNVLDEDQGRWAEVYADPFPVGPSPFRADGPPVIETALGHMVCRVDRTVAAPGAALLVIGTVETAEVRHGARPLLWYRRATTRLEP
jgi:flavin reductase (DIM6/NTAB) family NADH-FMN oxidoreductase RutF